MPTLTEAGLEQSWEELVYPVSDRDPAGRAILAASQGSALVGSCDQEPEQESNPDPAVCAPCILTMSKPLGPVRPSPWMFF